ncbi:MAG: C39 family peptidase [Phycisphaerales bacterium]|nr:C39 family peptidase [Phycisphaerales bacterium]
MFQPRRRKHSKHAKHQWDRPPAGQRVVARAAFAPALFAAILLVLVTPRSIAAPYAHTTRLSESPIELHPEPAAAPLKQGSAVEHLGDTIAAPEINPFMEALLSWNVDVPPGAGVRFEVRVGLRDRSADGSEALTYSWSDWLFLGEWGDLPPRLPIRTEFEFASTGGKPRARGGIEVDALVSDQPLDAIQWRAVAVRGLPIAPAHDPGATTRPIVIRRVAICTTASLDKTPQHVPLAPRTPPGRISSAESLARAVHGYAIDVPFRSQRTPDPLLSGRLCSPTSVSMVLASHGVSRPVFDVSSRAYDIRHDIFGNWPRNIQAAYALGVPGYLTRFSQWSDVYNTLDAGTPLVVSIQVKKGELRGAPYSETGGHLIVVRGYDAAGDLLVNDPASGEESKGRLVYKREDLQKVWMERTLGTTYVLSPLK